MIHCPKCNQKKSYGRTIVHLCDSEIAFFGNLLNPTPNEYQWNCNQNMGNISQKAKHKQFISPLILFEKNFLSIFYE